MCYSVYVFKWVEKTVCTSITEQISGIDIELKSKGKGVNMQSHFSFNFVTLPQNY